MKSSKSNDLMTTINNNIINYRFEISDTGYDNRFNINIVDKIKTDLCIDGRDHETIIDETYGSIVCQKCGKIIDTIIDQSPEWNNYDDICDTRCTQMNMLLPQSSMSIPIMNGSRRIKTLQTWHSMPYNERSLNNEYKYIDDICNTHDIPRCIATDSKYFFKKISECQIKGRNVIFRGKNRRNVIVACVYLSYAKSENTKTPKEISNIFKITKKDLTKGIKKFYNILRKSKTDINIVCCSPEHFVENYCKQLKLSKNLTDMALSIARNIKTLGIHLSHTPISLACGSILLCVNNCNHEINMNLTEKILAKKFDISVVTIVKAYKKILEYKNKLLSDIHTNSKNIPNKITVEDIKNKLNLLLICKNNGILDLDMLDNFDLNVKKFLFDIN